MNDRLFEHWPDDEEPFEDGGFELPEEEDMESSLTEEQEEALMELVMKHIDDLDTDLSEEEPPNFAKMYDEMSAAFPTEIHEEIRESIAMALRIIGLNEGWEADWRDHVETRLQ